MFSVVSTSDVHRANINTRVQTEPVELRCDSVRRKIFRDTGSVIFVYKANTANVAINTHKCH